MTEQAAPQKSSGADCEGVCTKRRTHALVLLVTGFTLAACATSGEKTPQGFVAPSFTKPAAADPDTYDADKYYAPAEFFGYAWGTPLTAIPNLKLVSGGVSLAAGYRGKVMDIQIQNCTPNLDPDAEVFAPCEIRQQVQGAGSYVMASYYREFEPYNPYADTALAAAVYYFCARTNGDFVSKYVRRDLRLCGGDVVFQSDVRETWSEDDPPTNYESVVSSLTAYYGRPDDFAYSGYVTVEDEFGRQSTLSRERTDDPLFWCKITERALDPSCKATITLDFDNATGTGRVLFATNAVYRFAEALNEQSAEKIPLYERLRGRQPDRFRSKRQVCTGTRLCGGTSRKLTDEELAVFRPEAGNTDG